MRRMMESTSPHRKIRTVFPVLRLIYMMLVDRSGRTTKKKVNNSTVFNNINDNNNNISGLDNEENTPCEVNCENNNKLLESFDLYLMNLQTEIPILRLRGGVGEEVNVGQNEEETVGERFILTTLDEEESEAIGGRIEDAKLPGINCARLK
jgi:hypothetical protein